jgi:hypothetical protein
VSPKAGTAVSLVAPPAPKEAEEAVKAEAGQAEKSSHETAEATAGSTTATKVGPAGGAGSGDSEPPKQHQPDKEKKGWIEIVLKNEEGTPLGGTRYVVTLPDGTQADGTLDDKGKARVEGFDPGSCKVTFPELDQKVWKAK